MSDYKKDAGSKMQCPVCGEYFDYLLGEVKQGCETCYDKSKDYPDKSSDIYDRTKEIEV